MFFLFTCSPDRAPSERAIRPAARADAMCVQIALWKKSEKENLQLRVLSNEILDMKVEERGKWSASALGTTFNPNEWGVGFKSHPPLP